MLYNIWLIGVLIMMLLLLIMYRNVAGFEVKCELNEEDYSKVGAFIIIMLFALLWPLILVIATIDYFND